MPAHLITASENRLLIVDRFKTQYSILTAKQALLHKRPRNWKTYIGDVLAIGPLARGHFGLVARSKRLELDDIGSGLKTCPIDDAVRAPLQHMEVQFVGLDQSGAPTIYLSGPGDTPDFRRLSLRRSKWHVLRDRFPKRPVNLPYATPKFSATGNLVEFIIYLTNGKQVRFPASRLPGAMPVAAIVPTVSTSLTCFLIPTNGSQSYVVIKGSKVLRVSRLPLLDANGYSLALIRQDALLRIMGDGKLQVIRIP